MLSQGPSRVRQGEDEEWDLDANAQERRRQRIVPQADEFGGICAWRLENDRQSVKQPNGKTQ